jgi:hypothetical protein
VLTPSAWPSDSPPVCMSLWSVWVQDKVYGRKALEGDDTTLLDDARTVRRATHLLVSFKWLWKLGLQSQLRWNETRLAEPA